jgi:heme ABC exporter ATP-binding subunit CcmA
VSAPAVALRGLVKRFGPVVALRGIDLEVPAGAVQVLVGPNGAGKTTLLRILAGLARPSAGSVQVAGDARDRRSARRRIGYIGHNTLLYPALTARENLIFAGRLYGVADPSERAAALIAEYELDGAAERPAGACSRGTAQRLAIARGLVHDPEVVLLDEPFTGLDPRSAERLVERISALRREGRTVFLVSHDLVRAAALGDRSAVLVGGRLAWSLPAPCDGAALEAAYRTALGAAP